MEKFTTERGIIVELVVWCDKPLMQIIMEQSPKEWHIVCMLDDEKEENREEHIENIPVVDFCVFRKKYLAKVDGALVVIGDSESRAVAANLLYYYGIYNIGFPLLHRAFEVSQKGTVWTEGKPYLSAVEIHLMDSCNLNCTGCSHFSNLFDGDSEYDYNRFVEDLSVLSRRICFSTLYLLGGEPLANPNLIDYLRAARRIFPKREIVLVTNGLLIPRQTDEVFEVLRQEKIDIEISLYPPTAKMLDKIEARMKDTGVYFHIRAERPTFMAFMGTEGTSDPYISQQVCCNAHCRYIRNGKLYKCPVDALSYKYSERFGVNLPPSEGVSLVSGQLERELALLEEPIQLCRYCKEEPRVFPWAANPHPAKEDWFGNL